MSEFRKTLNYIKQKSKKEILRLQKLLAKKRVIIVPLAQKMGGKSYYLQFFTRAVGERFFTSIGVGDIFRRVKKQAGTAKGRGLVLKKLSEKFKNPEKELETVLKSTSSSLVPDDLTFFLLESEFRNAKKSIILDGIPRSNNQLKYIKELEKETGMQVFLCYFATSYEVLDLRADSRRVCPKCNLDLNIISMPSSSEVWKNGEFVMMCENCKTVEMIQKPGDESKKEIQRARKSYENIITKAKTALRGKLVNIETCVQVKEYKGPIEEVNRAFTFELKGGKVTKIEREQVVKTEKGPVYALSPKYVSSLLIEKLSGYQGVS